MVCGKCNSVSVGVSESPSVTRSVNSRGRPLSCIEWLMMRKLPKCPNPFVYLSLLSTAGARPAPWLQGGRRAQHPLSVLSSM